jgi:hypothetical protein
MRLRTSVIALAVAAIVILAPRAARSQDVDAALVIAIDVSGSVNAERFELQRRGVAETIASAEFIEAVSLGPRHGVAIVVFEWSGVGERQVVVPWTVLRMAEDAEAAAARLLEAPRAFSGSTAVGEAIHFAIDLLAVAPAANRRVIDVSGDGRVNSGRPAGPARDAAVAAGIVINGLPILDVEVGLEDWYRENVQGGDGSFTLPARTLRDFRRALLAKLIREIS